MNRYASAEDCALLTRFESHLADAGFSRIRCAEHLERVDAFLRYLHEAQIAPEAVTPADLLRYVQARLQGFVVNTAAAPKTRSAGDKENERVFTGSWHLFRAAGRRRSILRTTPIARSTRY